MTGAAPAKDEAGGARAGILSSAMSTSRSMEGHVIVPLRKRRMAAITGRQRMSFEPYDFRNSDKLSKEHLRTLQVIHEAFARLITSSISGYLRSTVQIELISIEQVTYDEYVRSISASLINVLNVSPLSGQSMMEIDMRILFAMIDRLLGGAGEGHFKQGKDLTDVEKILAGNIVNRALAELAIAWQEIVPLDFTVATVETSAQFVQIVPGNDTVVLILLDVRLGEQQGAMSLAIPYMLLKPIVGRLHTHHWATSAAKTRKHLAPKMAERLREMTRVPIVARIGTSDVTVEAIDSLEIGEILPLNIARGTLNDRNQSNRAGAPGLSNVDVLVGDKIKFRGHIGLRGGTRLAVQIDDVVAPPPSLEIHRDAQE
jgi:flagellar motor switch protein FliM